MRQFQVRNGVCRITFDEQCVAQQLVCRNQIRLQLDSLLQWWDGAAVLMIGVLIVENFPDRSSEVGTVAVKG